MGAEISTIVASSAVSRTAIVESLKTSSTFRKTVQAVFAGGATAVAALLGLVARSYPAPTDLPWVVGSLVCIMVAFAASVILAVTERSVADVVQENHRLEDEIAKLERAVSVGDEVCEELGADIDWLLTLYNTGRASRFLAASLAEQGVTSEDELRNAITQLLEIHIAQQGKLVGIDADYWSLAVYVPDTETKNLYCFVCRRSNSLDEISEHRIWPKGVGHVGRSFDEKSEIIVDDTLKPEYKQFFKTPAEMQKDYDDRRYRSMVSVPIRLNDSGEPQGILIATSNVAGRYFNKDLADDGSVKDPIEPLRALAGALALLYATRNPT